MFKQTAYTESMSIMMSKVLSDIGVNEEMVLRRRKVWLLNELMETKSKQIFGHNMHTYFLGSQSEGSTTGGINSDVDQLICLNDFNVIDDLNGWKRGVINVLKIQEEGEVQGFCKLQLLHNDHPSPCHDVPNNLFFKDKTGKVLFKNTAMHSMIERAGVREGFKHGPAYTKSITGCHDTDIVMALPLNMWPQEAKQWLEKQGQWPTEEMMKYCRSSMCFVVGVGRKDGENDEIEWRVSTALAERCLMFYLSITQIRCYVLMKFVLKTFIKPSFGDAISSYMCKNILFHCIANTENTHSEVWSERNILLCLSRCLLVLYTSIYKEKCPHFISSQNNIMKGKILANFKPGLLKTLQSVIKRIGLKLLQIECDGFGVKLQILMNINSIFSHYAATQNQHISGFLTRTFAAFIGLSLCVFLSKLKEMSNDEIIQSLRRCICLLMNNCDKPIDRKVCYLLASNACGTLGSAIASRSIQQHNFITQEAISWISLSLKTDVASNKLKLASVFYGAGEYKRAEVVLRGIEVEYDLEAVEEVCFCNYTFERQPVCSKFNDISYWQGEEIAMRSVVAYCVNFFQYEINCTPHELRYEMFRTTKEDMRYRVLTDYWMDSAVVDSLPYLYFLKYRVFKKLGNQEGKEKARSSLAQTIMNRPNLGHRDTALNLLGQLQEEENHPYEALHYYIQSLKWRRRNNVASIHICRLLSKLVNEKNESMSS